jgi:hypothetical protein
MEDYRLTVNDLNLKNGRAKKVTFVPAKYRDPVTELRASPDGAICRRTIGRSGCSASAARSRPTPQRTARGKPVRRCARSFCNERGVRDRRPSISLSVQQPNQKAIIENSAVHGPGGDCQGNGGQRRPHWPSPSFQGWPVGT